MYTVEDCQWTAGDHSALHGRWPLSVSAKRDFLWMLNRLPLMALAFKIWWALAAYKANSIGAAWALRAKEVDGLQYTKLDGLELTGGIIHSSVPSAPKTVSAKGTKNKHSPSGVLKLASCQKKVHLSSHLLCWMEVKWARDTALVQWYNKNQGSVTWTMALATTTAVCWGLRDVDTR